MGYFVDSSPAHMYSVLSCVVAVDALHIFSMIAIDHYSQC